jgi:wyosine [tRNA(Phe)-imidazoG37] synthetase (radical SAM superfamily)
LIAFGPVPSRRLGRSLGVNHVQPKACSYSCVYCQVGRTEERSIGRRAFFEPATVHADVTTHVARLRAHGEAVDWLSFVPDGEPTLDVHLGRHIELLRPLGIPIAVITNSTLLWMPDVRAELAAADWVCVKVDAVDEAAWHRVDRPHPALRLDDVLDGIRAFAGSYAGTLTTDTMLVGGANDGETRVRRIAEFVGTLRPRKAYLSVPTRPPAEPGVQPPPRAALLRAYRLFAEHVPVVEPLFDEVVAPYASTGDVADDLLRIAAVHPVRLDAALELLARAGSGSELLERLFADGRLARADYGGQPFVVRPATAAP